MSDGERIKQLEAELMKLANNYNNLWAAVEVAFGVHAGFFPNAQALIEHGCKLRKTEPPASGKILVQGWRPRNAGGVK